MTYIALNAAFIAISVVVLAIAVLTRSLTRESAPAIIGTTAIVFIMTAVFDNLMIAVGLFEYSSGHTSGLRIGLAPLEDFGYPLAGALLLPALWALFGGVEERTRPDHSRDLQTAEGAHD